MYIVKVTQDHRVIIRMESIAIHGRNDATVLKGTEYDTFIDRKAGTKYRFKTKKSALSFVEHNNKEHAGHYMFVGKE